MPHLRAAHGEMCFSLILLSIPASLHFWLNVPYIRVCQVSVPVLLDLMYVSGEAVF